ncbi:MAG: DUF2279 domain-containing protein [Candidatus Marinimicrobia bacterium]|nr:DUF2279 domain-containing protein [Candidatus Neomarinimicrobiota bacterium]
MKLWCGFLFVLLMVFVSPGRGEENNREDRWGSIDKLQHFSSSFYLTVTAYYYLNKFDGVPPKDAGCYSAVLTLNMGLGKELYDKYWKKTFFSGKDFVADLLGVLFGLIFVENFT